MKDAKISELVAEVQVALVSQPTETSKIIGTVEALLSHLSSPLGRTDSNCRYVDSFFMDHDEWAYLDLPDPLHDIFADISGALHDTCTAPHVAENFDSTPEQLLNRLKQYK